jgi:hypothetical protein
MGMPIIIDDEVLYTPACGYWDCECCPKDNTDCSKCPCKRQKCVTCDKRCEECAIKEAKRRYEKAQAEGREYEKRWAEEHANDGKTTFSERIANGRQSTNIEDRRFQTFEEMSSGMTFPGWATGGGNRRIESWSDWNDRVDRLGWKF